MARTSLDKDSLASKIKDIEGHINPKMINKLALDDLKALYLLANKIKDAVSDVLDNAFPDFIAKNNKPTSTLYRNTNTNYGSAPSNAPVGIASLAEDTKLVISGDMGTGFNAGGISLYDVTEEIVNNTVINKIKDTLQAQNPDVLIEEITPEDEHGRLNDIFATIEDVQQ